MSATNETASAGLTVPGVLDGTGLTTSVPLLVKNAKNLSGIELQVTGTAPTGYLLRDSAGTQKGVLGYAVALNDWVTGAAAGGIVLSTVGALLLDAPAATGVTIRGNVSGTLALTSAGSVLSWGASTSLAMGSAGITAIAASAYTFVGTAGALSGSSNASATWTLASTTNATKGIMYLGNVAGSESVSIDALKNVAIGSAALAAAATDGFLYIPGGPGTPSGVPTAKAGRYPLYWDTTNKKFYVYDGAWLGGTAPGAWT